VRTKFEVCSLGILTISLEGVEEIDGVEGKGRGEAIYFLLSE
jgi:hypothetical protein